MKTIFCPECNHALNLSGHLHQGQRLICPHCTAGLTVSKTHPPELELVTYLTESRPKAPPQEAACPECSRPIRFRTRLQEGQMVTCSRCHAELEVVNLTPLELEPAVPGIRQLRRNQRRSKEASRRFEQQPFGQGQSGKKDSSKHQKYRQDDEWDDN